MNFFKTLIASILGVFLALGLMVLISVIVISSSTKEPEPYIRDNSVLKIELQGSLPAKKSTNPLDEIFRKDNKGHVSLESLKNNLIKARHHDKIKGIWLQIDHMTGSWANLEEARRLINTFRDSSDKFIYASTNDLGYNEKGYFLATAADSVFSPPETFFEFDGFFMQVAFYKGLFEKLDIQTEIIRHGKYKSAVEPFFRKDMSEESKYQMNEMLDQISSTFVDAVSQKTGHSVDELNGLMNDQPHMTSQFAYDAHLVDSLIYPNQLSDLIEKRIGLEEDESFKTVSNARYADVSPSSAGMEDKSADDKIGVIYASGPIMPAVSSDLPFGGQEVITNDFFKKQLEDIRDDDDIKALVIRVNSPGGAGSTSDLIWNQLRELQKEMPVIVSMGGVAASGGYYISVAADTIVAESTTITGSIGVFSTKFNTKGFFNNKLGRNFDDVKRHKHADWMVQNEGLTSSEEKAFQQFTDNFYQSFVQKVANSRNMDVTLVDSLGQGRVWIGADAKKQGLVDIIGGMERALKIAAEKAELSNYQIAKFPKSKSFFEYFMNSTTAKAKIWLQ